MPVEEIKKFLSEDDMLITTKKNSFADIIIKDNVMMRPPLL